MPKDTPFVTGDLHDEDMERKAMAALKREAYAASFDRRADQVKSDLKKLPTLADQVANLTGQIESLKRAVDRPQNVSVTAKLPAEAKVAQAVPSPLKCAALAISAELVRRMDHTTPADFIKTALPGDKYRLTRSAALRMHKSATVGAGTPTVGWAQELTSTGLGDMFVDLAPVSALAKLVSQNYSRRLNFAGHNAVTHPKRSRDTLAATWVSEKGHIPVKSGFFGSSLLSRYKIGVIAVLSDEIRNVTRPEITGLIETAILEDSASALDQFFFDAEPATPLERPAGIMNGATEEASAGSTVEQINTDLKWLLQQLITIRARKPVLILHPLTVAALTMVTTSGTGIAPFKEDIEKGVLAGIPFLTSDLADPTRIIALDGDSIYVGLDAPMFDASSEAMLIMSDAPETDTGVETRSLFQSVCTGIRFIQPASWGLARPGISFAITGVDY